MAGTRPAMASVKTPCALQQRRHGRDHRAADGLPLPLVVGEEERPVPPDRAADDAAELVAPELRLDRRSPTRRSCGRSAPRGGRTRRRCRATALLPALVVRLTTPPLKRPNSAGGLLLSILNSWMASMFGKNATCPGSGCSTEMPSNRYSLVRGRPPLMRGSGEPGGSATPGARPASVMKLRPFSGSRRPSGCRSPGRDRRSRCAAAAHPR